METENVGGNGAASRVMGCAGIQEYTWFLFSLRWRVLLIPQGVARERVVHQSWVYFAFLPRLQRDVGSHIAARRS